MALKYQLCVTAGHPPDKETSTRKIAVKASEASL